MSSTRAAPTELHFEGALDAIDGPRLWRSEASKLTHDPRKRTFPPANRTWSDLSFISRARAGRIAGSRSPAWRPPDARLRARI
jgi:hypothetical protein